MTAKECRNNCGRVIEWDNENRYFIEVANGQRHRCPNYKRTGNEGAKQAVEEYHQKFPKEDELLKKIEAGISTSIELSSQAVLLARDIIMLAKGEDVEKLLADKDEEIAGLKEAVRQDVFKKGSEVVE